jgi:hypothetical protein
VVYGEGSQVRHLSLLLAAGVTSLWVWALAGCAVSNSGDQLVGRSEVYTLVNLHPDETRRRLYSVNYQQPGLIPLCTKVKIESVTSDEMTFQVVEDQRRYHYIFHNSLRDPIAKHLDKYFGPSCPARKIESLSEVDRAGIRQGRVLEGMSKDGVILAVGYPPEHVTPTLESNAWRYWMNRFGTQVIHFVDGKVVRIQD